MAQARLGPLVSDIAGSIGGTTLQRSFLGTQLRSRPNPIRRRTSYTATARQSTTFASRTWKELSSTQRSGWQEVADGLVWYNRFGEVIRGKGYWLFLRCNQYLALLGEPPVLTATTPPTFEAITDAACSYSPVPVMALSWSSPAAVPSGIAWLLFASPRLSTGRSAPFGQLRFIGSLAAGRTSPQSILSRWHSRFNQYPAALTQAFLQIIQVEVSSGHTSAPIALTANL